MTKKERVTAVLEKKVPDRLPTQSNFTAIMRQKIAAHLDMPENGIDDRFANHLLRVDLSYKKLKNGDGTTAYDWWGSGFDITEEGYRIADHPLSEQNNLEKYSWPDPDQPELLDGASAALESNNGLGDDEQFSVPNFGFVLFERAWALRGLEQFMMDLALDPAWCEDLLERITEIQIILAARFVQAGVDGGYFGDDLGAQRGLLFSPDMWRKMFKPRLKRIFDVFTTARLPVIMHSDGDIKEIIPDLIEIGLTCLNPCQPEVLDHRWLKKEYGKDLTFYGGLSTQETLPRGTPDQVREAGKTCIENLASDGTGLLYGPSHRMMSDIPMENIDALLETFDYCIIR